jgi:acyl-[acyl-carrier-protein]-phospholipid O-acyltransferase/long-chain-fatty-acid--[acyl-carrier-protein] ligase
VGPTAPILFATLLEIALDYAWAWGTAVLLLGAAVCVFHYFFLVRLPMWVLRHTLYRVRVHGLENVPASGSALLVSNHVSFIDAIIILAAQRRRIRFLIWAPFTGVPGLRLFLRLLRVIPIDSRAGPRAIIESLRTASDALTAGEVVCIFAEGGITHTGFLLPFARGFEQIVKRSPVPIVPVCVDHVWGSIFSYQGGTVFWKFPKQLPYVVHVNFGTPLPPTSDSFTVRQAIQKLSADSAIRRGPERKPVHRGPASSIPAIPPVPCSATAWRSPASRS